MEQAESCGYEGAAWSDDVAQTVAKNCETRSPPASLASPLPSPPKSQLLPPCPSATTTASPCPLQLPTLASLS